MKTFPKDKPACGLTTAGHSYVVCGGRHWARRGARVLWMLCCLIKSLVAWLYTLCENSSSCALMIGPLFSMCVIGQCNLPKKKKNVQWIIWNFSAKESLLNCGLTLTLFLHMKWTQLTLFLHKKWTQFWTLVSFIIYKYHDALCY